MNLMSVPVVLHGSSRLDVEPEVQELGDFLIRNPQYIEYVAGIIVECKTASQFQEYLEDEGSAIYALSYRDQLGTLMNLLRNFYQGPKLEQNRGRLLEYLTGAAIPFQDGWEYENKRYHVRFVWSETNLPVVEGAKHDLDVAAIGRVDEDVVCEGYECKVFLENMVYWVEGRFRGPDERKIDFMVDLEKQLTNAKIKTEIGFVTFKDSAERFVRILQKLKGCTLTVRMPRELSQRLAIRRDCKGD